MRAILLAGVAVMAFAPLSTTTANAGSAWYIAKHLLWECKEEVHHTKPQANCGANYVGGHYGSSDDNTQKIKQRNKAFLYGTDPDDLKQVNLGVNVVNKGDYNYQSIKQSNKAIGIYSDDIEQKNVGVNTVDHGDGNTQKIEQKNFAKAVGTDEDIEQKNVATNSVENGDDNYQSIDQSNGLIAIGSY
ncbi:hypothetical protein PRN20_06875 [Devosia sp. ZB163]|uniref:hypothetical protein n=1 Tax=Devosia sp. ZB163 TaxID=3025938 RepID=UPI0023619A92|nr:hypothetical protein [Devosia sp. ZB163]MDC9823451.1 hypothetical protein [Devosia sp. ZB163]